MTTQNSIKQTSKMLSDRINRFDKVFEATVALCEVDAEAALKWLDKPVCGLGNRKPFDMLETQEETDEVLGLIRNIEHGVFM